MTVQELLDKCMRKGKPRSTFLVAIGGACHPGSSIMMVILIHEHSMNMIYGVGVRLAEGS